MGKSSGNGGLSGRDHKSELFNKRVAILNSETTTAPGSLYFSPALMFADITSGSLATSWGRPAKPYPTCFRTTVDGCEIPIISKKKGGKHHQ